MISIMIHLKKVPRPGVINLGKITPGRATFFSWKNMGITYMVYFFMLNTNLKEFFNLEHPEQSYDGPKFPKFF